VIWAGEKYQVGIEAFIPINRSSGRGVGIRAALHWYLGEIFPDSIGRPLLGGAERP
jgi:hypothetical protein